MSEAIAIIIRIVWPIIIYSGCTESSSLSGGVDALPSVKMQTLIV
jgi:hypothetical protein